MKILIPFTKYYISIKENNTTINTNINSELKCKKENKLAISFEDKKKIILKECEDIINNSKGVKKDFYILLLEDLKKYNSITEIQNKIEKIDNWLETGGGTIWVVQNTMYKEFLLKFIK